MILCIDVGNSHLYAGVFVDDTIKVRFRYPSSKVSTSDELGVFLAAVLRENQCDPTAIREIAICSVVPNLDYSLRAACVKYFSIEPFFLHVGVRTGITLHYRNPQEIGADRLANVMAGVRLYPEKHLMILDFGTATTLCVVRAPHTYCGGAILPGVRLSADALSANTAKLPCIEIVKRTDPLGLSTIEGIQSGIYFGMMGACRELMARVRETVFSNEPVHVLATGGFAPLFEGQGLYDEWKPDLVLQGLREALQMNRG